MTATIDMERYTAELNKEEGQWAIFEGRNLIRFIIASWPKVTQQFVGLSVFNTYATYFCKYQTIFLGISPADSLSSPGCREQEPIPRHRHPLLCPDSLHDRHLDTH